MPIITFNAEKEDVDKLYQLFDRLHTSNTSYVMRLCLRSFYLPEDFAKTIIESDKKNTTEQSESKNGN